MDPVVTHSCHLLQQLHEQRIQGLLCDCMLVVKGVCFKAHKNVLAAFSQYFRSLFQNSSGQKNDVFHLDIKNVSGIGQILDFMYTSRLDLNQDNIQGMLDIAQCLQVQNVLHLCHTFLKSATVDQPPGLPCNSTFSLQGTLAPDTNCVISENYPPHLPQECSAGAQQSKALEESHSHAPSSLSLHHSTTETSKQAPETLDGSCPELSFKQPNYYYKLRNFYSKQYYKQASCPSHERVIEQPFPFSASPELHGAEHQPCAVSHSECVLESSEHLPSNFLAPPLSDSAPDPESDNACQQPTRQMRLKKAIHLRKLNFLKSQKSAEPTSEPKSDDSLTKRTESANEDSREKVDSQSAEEKEREELISSESFNCGNEMERPEDPAALEDQSQTLQSQRQYACELCGKPFKHPSNLELHKRSHTDFRLGCPQSFSLTPAPVSPGFSNFSNLKEHKKTHTADKVFTCDECGKSFNMQRKLVKHRVRHTGERPYSCSACGKCFGGSGDLRRHVRTHTGEKPYTCDVCSKCFTRSAVLRRHRKMHCRADDAGLAPPIAPSEPGKPRSADSFSQDVSVTLMPVSVKLPVHPVEEEPVTEFDSHSAGSYCKFRPTVQPHGVGDQERLSLDPAKAAKPPLPQAQPQAYAYADAAGAEPLQADGMAMIRSSLAALDQHCGDPLGSRAAAPAHRNSDGQFFSSMTLWGLAMKTLQNESELDQ
ncbi:zinc finger and BTB domain-containing protein 49 isoform X2 [Vicugna pacos]|uniref:Zinc finger and BTB domain-containing protein 49 isoform X2 n=1 Tax=Vicugna pacos TaxID=30538 RepID=A0ABM5C187_VICPA